MRSYRLFFILVALVLCLHSVAAVPQAAVRRQDDKPVERSQTPSITRDASIRPSATGAPSDEESSIRRTESDRAPSTSTTAPKPSDSASGSAAPIAPQSATPTAPAASSTPEADLKDQLPFEPTLTPAMGLTGVILLLTGLTYAVIGIKNKWVYVFGSAAYLTALSVTVLIIYLMSPPVSNAVQGGFFVAAFFTGAIFGGLSLVFSDITEGFGCLLGGFCLSMWFLSLKSGGLISSTTGRAIFIGCFSAGGFSLSFSHHTRNYGLIASIAFSGATATILGIDCLSRAGWKEFWLYLWALNDNVFPLNTDTFPLTKNIKAELAGVVIITAFGVVSQMRVWRLVKEHREKSAAQQLEKQQDQEREEEELGRQIEDNFQRERKQWEATYGQKGAQDSTSESSGTSLKKAPSVREKEFYSTDSLDLVDVKRSGVKHSSNPDTPAGTTVTVSVMTDEIQEIDAEGNPIVHDPLAVGSKPGSVEKDLPETPEILLANGITKKTSLRSSVPPPPPIVPLPFKIPQATSVKGEDDDNASVSAVPETEDSSFATRRPMSKRISDMSNLRQTSGARISRNISEFQEDLADIPHVEDDRASSIAATLDDDNDDASLRQLSRPQSPIGTEHEIVQPVTESSEDKAEQEVASNGDVASAGPEKDVEAEAAPASEADDTQEISEDATAKETSSRPKLLARQSLTTSTDPKPHELRKQASILSKARLRKDSPISSEKGSSESNQPAKVSPTEASSQSSQTEQESSRVSSLREVVLPARLSKVALSYRTNEWAKHLEAAEIPELEELHVPSSPGVALEHDDGEMPAPVSDEIAYPLTGSRRESKRMSTEKRTSTNYGYGLNRSTSTTFSQQSAEQQAMSRSPSVLSKRVLSRSNSGAQPDGLAPLPSNTLMGQREKLMRNRVSSQSFTPLASAANTLVSANEQDDMTLAQRRQLLQQGVVPANPAPSPSGKRPPPSTSQKWQKKGWTSQGAGPGFDSHQPQRMSNSQSDAKREELYAGWRETIQDVGAPPAATWIAEQQRAALLSERQQKEAERRQREAMAQQRASVLDNAMRSGHMLDAHREAMRKMQANANKQI